MFLFFESVEFSENPSVVLFLLLFLFPSVIHLEGVRHMYHFNFAIHVASRWRLPRYCD